MKMKTKFLGAIAAIPLTFAASQALADPIVEWDFDVTAEWVTAGPGAPTFAGGGGGTQVVNSTLLSWGVDGGARSSLEITDTPAEGSIFTNGAAEDTVVITHDNQTLPGGTSYLSTATLLTTLTLTRLDPAGPTPGLFPVNAAVPIEFIETTNTSDINNCGFPTTSACDDIFVVPFSGLQFSFILDGYKYTTTIGATGLGPLPDATCSKAGVANGCFGLTTQEGGENPVQFNFAITAQEVTVPVPATLALMGLGLLGLGATARRRKAA